MERQPIPCKPLAQHTKDAFGVKHILERHDGIIGEADKGTSACKPWSHLVLEPFVQHVVQEDVRQQGEITPPCGEPSVVWRRTPSSRIPAFSHLSIIRRITPSMTRRSRKSRR